MDFLNFLKIIDSLVKFKDYNKQKVNFIKKLNSINKDNIFDILYFCSNILIDERRDAYLGINRSREKKYENIKKIMYEVLNDSAFISNIKESKHLFFNKWKISGVIDLLHKFFKEDTILDILNSNALPKTYFLIFGSHPALLKNFDLQKKWIYYYADSKLITPYLKYFYITDEALENVPVSVGFNFVYNFLNYANIEKDNIPCFKLKTLINILHAYSASNGNGKNVEKVRKVSYIITNIKNFPRLNLIL